MCKTAQHSFEVSYTQRQIFFLCNCESSIHERESSAQIYEALTRLNFDSLMTNDWQDHIVGTTFEDIREVWVGCGSAIALCTQKQFLEPIRTSDQLYSDRFN
jgi:hypothetical protein